MPELWVAQLGRIPYAEAFELQRELHARRVAGELRDVLLVLEHPAVYTRGRRTEPSDLPMGEGWYRARGIDVCETDRGGRVTYHGPGQLVAYPIMAVDRVTPSMSSSGPLPQGKLILVSIAARAGMSSGSASTSSVASCLQSSHVASIERTQASCPADRAGLKPVVHARPPPLMTRFAKR